MALVPVDEWPAGHTRIDSRIIAVDPRAGMGPWGSAGYLEMSRWLPDLDDAATIGCLLRLVRDAWGAPNAHAVRLHTNDFTDGPGSDLGPVVWWALCLDDSSTPTRSGPHESAHAGATEPAALVAALLAAP